MKQLTTSSLKQGYITIPRALLNRQATDGAAGETEAFLQILAHTNYSDVPYDINGTIILCKRGDSLISYHHWSNIFGWTRPKTTRFFQRLAKGGIIDLIPHQEKILHIRITNFDLWTGRIPSEAKDTRKGRNLHRLRPFLGQIPHRDAEAESQRRPRPPRMEQAHPRGTTTGNRPHRGRLLPHQRHPLHRPRFHLPERQGFSERIYGLKRQRICNHTHPNSKKPS